MNAQNCELDAMLTTLRAEAQTWAPPAKVDAAIATAVKDRDARSRRARLRDHWIAWPLALAASLAIVAVAMRTLSPQAALEEPAPTVSLRPTFTPVVPIAQIRETADAVIVPARVPRMTLAQYGLPLDPAHADDPVDAELLVRRDGALLAYRFAE